MGITGLLYHCNDIVAYIMEVTPKSDAGIWPKRGGGFERWLWRKGSQVKCSTIYNIKECLYAARVVWVLLACRLLRKLGRFLCEK